MPSIAVAVDDLLQGLLVPSRDEIAVDREPCGVTVGPYEGALLPNETLEAIAQLVGIPVDLVEEVGGVDPTLGAVELAVAGIRGERHVVLVVGQASGGVVARRKVKIHAHGRGISVAVLEGEADAGALVVRVANASHGAIRALGPAGGVEVAARAGDLGGLDGSLGRVEVLATVTGRDSPLVGISTEDLKAKRERLDIIIGGLEEVVDVHVEEVDLLKVAIIGVLEEEGWEPIRALVGLGLRRGASRVDQVLSSGVDAKVARAQDGMEMARRATGVDDGIGTAGCKGASSIMAEHGKGAPVFGRGNRGDQSRQDSGEKHVSFWIVGSLLSGRECVRKGV